ncbi:receptor like protein 30-like [Phalaenopsis equestris]|uniref:receptor like protein 30-like n=1 Tax=Phalaenopsis equestris TaxID=78828 RepID=UPI0009E25B84|nr:receptor like protein 30-like [Phalaenopsis equestris]
MPTLMERVQLPLLFIFTLSFYCLRAESEGGFAISKVNQHCSAEERETLLDFKQSLSDPNLVLSNWDIDEDCCTWKGVSCSNKTNRVIKLNFSVFQDLFYAASLHPSFFRLRHLQYLCFNNILFNQTRIPHSIGSLTKLRYLDLSHSGFAGEIPPHIGNLTKLRYLDLSYNSLVAYNLLWMSHLFSLQFVEMSNLNLTFATNWLHEISVLPALSTLHLSSCGLQTLPNLLPYSNFSSSIELVDLSYNHLIGSFPNWSGQFIRLNELYLDSNFFTGPISFASLSLLCDLNLGNNQFDGLIPHSLGQLSNLVTLDLGSNNLHGSLSESHFANLSQLINLQLSGNQLNFNLISPNWTPPFQIRYLYLSSCLVGPQFPLWLQNQKLLSVFDLSNCGITDIIPHSELVLVGFGIYHLK